MNHGNQMAGNHGNQMAGLQLRSMVKASGELELSLVRVAVPEPGADEVVVRIEASPINPSDLGLLLADASPADGTSCFVNNGGAVVLAQKGGEGAGEGRRIGKRRARVAR